MFDVTALGELLMDFTPAGLSEFGSPLFEQNAGGAPANVAACVTRLGGTAAYIGKVGQDAFGRALKDKLVSMGVDVTGVKDTRFYPTAMAFILPDENGADSYSFYHSNTADVR
ncbi:MAG: PfkB family carbohydrate kinase, partial [Acetanaerobacterium sp.]